MRPAGQPGDTEPEEAFGNHGRSLGHSQPRAMMLLQEPEGFLSTSRLPTTCLGSHISAAALLGPGP